jgi:hypothetical protein
MTWSSDDIVLACLEKYKAALGIEYRVTRWPDREESGSPEIDTYAEAPDAMPLAFEVTKIESFSDQRFDDRRIAELADFLESELGSVFPQGVFVLVQSGVIKPGFDWKQGHARIKAYLLKVATALQPGTSRYVIPDVPFPVFISYEPDLRTRFAVGRISPADEPKSGGLLRSMEKALQHKATRLQEYRTAGARAVLILESHDIALISHVNVYVAFLKARKQVETSHLDHVWFCRTNNPHRLDQWYCFLGPDEILDRVNLPHLRLGPRYDAYWETGIREGRV